MNINLTREKIKTKHWGKFNVGKLLFIVNGIGITNNDLRVYPNGTIPCVQGGEFNNGIFGYLPENLKENKNYCYVNEMCISLARVGSSGAVNLQENGCFVGDKAKALILKKEYQIHKNKYIYLFLLTLLKRFKTGKYNVGIKSEEYLKNEILLPLNKNNEPDWDYMEKYVKEKIINYEKICKNKITKINTDINTKNKIKSTEWKEFDLNGENGVFELKNSISKIHNKDIKGGEGNIPYVTRTELNNGIARYINEQKVEINKGNCLSLGMDAVTIFYQDKDFYTGDKIKILRNPKLNKINSLFLIAVIKRVIKDNFSWGGKGLNFKELGKLKIKLPTKDNELDWDYMEKYILNKYNILKTNLK